MSDMPEQPKTKEIPAVTERVLLEDLTRTVKEGFHKQETVMLEFGERLVRVEIRQKDLEDRMTRNSTRAASESDINVRQTQEIVAEREAREALAKDVEKQGKKLDEVAKNVDAIKAVVTGFLASPKVKAVGWILFLAITGYAATKGITVPK